MTFRGFLMWVHLVLGLTGAIVVAILAVTGAYITLSNPLHRWLYPTPAISPFTGSADFPAIIERVEERFAPQRVVSIDVRDELATMVRLRDRSLIFVDPRTSDIISVRRSRVASLENLTAVMRRTHTELMLGQKGRLLIMIATLETLLLALSGLWLWWRKKHWTFTAWRGSFFRVSWNLHNATGIWFLLPILSMVVTGLLLGVPGPVYKVAGAQPAPWLSAPRSDRAVGDTNSIPMARALFVADSALPGGRIIRLVIPAGSSGGAYAVATSAKTVYVDQYSGAVIEVRGPRQLTAADHAIETVDQLHTGVIWGAPGQTIMALGCIMLAVMTITGVVLGWKRLLILFNATANSDSPG